MQPAITFGIRFLLLILCVLSPSLTHAQCNNTTLDNFTAEPDCDGPVLFVVFEFPPDVGDADIAVEINGVTENTIINDGFALISDLVFEPGEYIASISLLSNPNCSADILLDLPLCEESNGFCSYSNLSVEPFSCQGDSIFVLVDFDTQNLPASSDSFQVRINQELVSIESYDDLPIIAGPLNVQANLNVLAVTDVDITCGLATGLPDLSCDGLTGIEDEIAGLHIFPSPSTEYFHIQYDAPEELMISLFDLQGKLVLIKSLSDSSNQRIDVAHLNRGMYILAIESSDGRLLRKISLQ